MVLEAVGISTALIAFSPLVCAVVTSVSLVAASILSLAVLTSSATFFFKASFSSAVKFEASIALSLVLAALSMASLAFFLTSESAGTVTASIAVLPSWPALVAPSLVVAPSIASLAVWVAESTCLFSSCFSLSLRLLDLLIKSFCLPAA